MKKYDKTAVMQISQVYGPFNMLTAEGSSETSHQPNQVLRILYFRKYVIYKGQ